MRPPRWLLAAMPAAVLALAAPGAMRANARGMPEEPADPPPDDAGADVRALGDGSRDARDGEAGGEDVPDATVMDAPSDAPDDAPTDDDAAGDDAGAADATVEASVLFVNDAGICPAGLFRADRAGHCCRPGQRFARGECVGTPTSCEPGTMPAMDGGTTCVPRPCEQGRVRTEDGVHCCWPGQRWDEDRAQCASEAAQCPEGMLPLGGADCRPRLGVTSVTSATAATGARVTAAPRAPRAGMVLVPGGTFVMGARSAATLRYVTLAPFWIDRTEVTQAAYARCVAAGACASRSVPFAGTGSQPTLPAVNVTHQMAEAYCAWSGSRLPTEAEWELAARGYDARAYPWGERAPDCSIAVFSGCSDGPAPVATHAGGASPFGVMDLAGNVAEWTSDRPGPLRGGSYQDPVGPREGEMRVVRGGSFASPESRLRTHARAEHAPDEARFDVGFRCVRDR